MLFPKRQSISRVYAGNALASQIQFEITRDFFLESVYLEISGTVTAAPQTASADGILGLVKRLQLGTADGASNRNQTDVSGVSAIQRSFYSVKGMDQSTLNAYLIGPGTGTFVIRYPLYFAEPRLMDPVASAFMLPIPRYNSNPVLTVQFASQADMDVGGAPTFAIAAGISARLVMNKRQVDNINLATWETEFIEASMLYPSTQPQATYQLQTPGSYFMFGIRGYTSNAAWGDVSSPNGVTTLQLLGNNMRNSFFSDIMMENQLATQDNWSATTVRSQRNGLFPALAIYDFLSDRWSGDAMETTSALNANVLAGSGSNIQYMQDVTGGPNVKNAFFWQRVFGDLSPLKMRV